MSGFEELADECDRLREAVSRPVSTELQVTMGLPTVDLPFLSGDGSRVLWRPRWDIRDKATGDWLGFVSYDSFDSDDDEFEEVGPDAQLVLDVELDPESASEITRRVRRDYEDWMRLATLDEVRWGIEPRGTGNLESDRVAEVALAAWSLPDGPLRLRGFQLATFGRWSGTGDELIQVAHSSSATFDRIAEAQRLFVAQTELDGRLRYWHPYWPLTFDELLQLAGLSDIEMAVARNLFDSWSGSASRLVETVRAATSGAGERHDSLRGLQLAAAPPRRWCVESREAGSHRDLVRYQLESIEPF
jgi:hypothetical protein